MALRKDDFEAATDEELEDQEIEDQDLSDQVLDDEADVVSVEDIEEEGDLESLDDLDDDDDESNGHHEDMDSLEDELLRRRTRVDLEGIAADDTVSLYLKQMGQVALLTAEEEVLLAKHIEAGVNACKKLRGSNLTEEQREELEEIVRVGEQARTRLVEANTRLVVSVAKKYLGQGVPMLDLIQEGNIGLIHAVKKFDPYKGYRLISYAVWWIRAYIQNYLIKSWSIVKIGTTQAQRKLFFKLSQAKKELETLSKKNPEFSEIADSLGVKGSEVAEMDLRMGSRDLSLNEFINDDGETSHLDFLTHDGDNQEVSLIKNAERSLVKRDIAGALANLNERESFIIQHRIMADDPLTLQEIGDKYNITRERARQIEKQALKKVQLALPYLKPDN